jgi:hypothetical protein
MSQPHRDIDHVPRRMQAIPTEDYRTIHSDQINNTNHTVFELTS